VKPENRDGKVDEGVIIPHVNNPVSIILLLFTNNAKIRR